MTGKENNDTSTVPIVQAIAIIVTKNPMKPSMPNSFFLNIKNTSPQVVTHNGNVFYVNMPCLNYLFVIEIVCFAPSQLTLLPSASLTKRSGTIVDPLGASAGKASLTGLLLT
ncbi:hypothetical protein SAMN05518847_11140 [Paenibacillus sp. OV219]|nr:hypothetical protein SAMN05518847_11140 [Paenibacillus sp. OV219]